MSGYVIRNMGIDKMFRELSSHKIPDKLYSQIVDSMPILCVDVVIRNSTKVLLVKRANEPLAGEWWVIGGRVLKRENVLEAAARKVKEEVGLVIKLEDFDFMGYYSDFFFQNPLGVLSGLHTFSMVFEADIPRGPEIKLDSQSTAWKWGNWIPKRMGQKMVFTQW